MRISTGNSRMDKKWNLVDMELSEFRDRISTTHRTAETVEQYRKLQSRPLPPDLDYGEVNSLRLEARQKLNAVKPLNFGQAARISGVSPADITALMIYMETHRKEEKA